jgi:hypothetical protein
MNNIAFLVKKRGPTGGAAEKHRLPQIFVKELNLIQP